MRKGAKIKPGDGCEYSIVETKPGSKKLTLLEPLGGINIVASSVETLVVAVRKLKEKLAEKAGNLTLEDRRAIIELLQDGSERVEFKVAA